MLYGSECWALNQDQLQKEELGVTILDKETNKFIKRYLEIRDIVQ